MNTTEQNPGVSPAVLAELQEAAVQAARGVRDSKAIRRACERMDRLREENRRRFGIQNIGVQIIRAMRDAR
jgi:hypothetical protein